MNNKITVMLASILVVMFSIVTLSEAQTMKGEGLNARQKSIVTIAAFTASGDLQKLKTALNEGLDAGLTVNEIKEVLIQMYAYAGFPRSLNGIDSLHGRPGRTGKEGHQGRNRQGTKPHACQQEQLELGTEIQTRLIGGPVTGKYIRSFPPLTSS